MDVDAFREQSLQTWDSMAAGWEVRHAFLQRNMGHLNDWVIERATPSAGQVVLEVGAGPGDLGHRIAALVEPRGRVISTDFSSEMVEVAQRLGTTRGLGNVEYRQLDAEAMDLDDGSVDAVVGRSVYMLLADPAAALREARRVLRSGGSMAFTVFTTPDQNPWWSVPAAVLVQRGHLAPPQPGAPGVFSLGDPERVRALATGAGFSTLMIEHVDFVFHYADDEDAWNAIVDLNGPLAVIIDRLPTGEREATRRAVLDGFELFQDPDGSYPVPAQALAVHAR
ncbi:class I SAM-dependent methyltransferase [Ilumatobacter sp.]|uniref:class I SAM-dependent methyltransferase n=1 Tax=Ilumatobacter sp. TaxID=1967498 RepID=UPI003AF711FE